ncbi:hypothetical protein EMG75_27885, partial [Klebsiella pneumoniae]
DVTLKMPAFEWVHVQLHQQKGMISLSPPTICNSAIRRVKCTPPKLFARDRKNFSLRPSPAAPPLLLCPLPPGNSPRDG